MRASLRTGDLRADVVSDAPPSSETRFCSSTASMSTDAGQMLAFGAKHECRLISHGAGPVCSAGWRYVGLVKVTDSDPSFRAFLRAMRRPRGEAQWTQMIAALAKADPAFASRLASVLIEAAPRRDERGRLGAVPERLICTPEVVLSGVAGQDLGRVDLRFVDELEKQFEVLAELKLGASYGWQQLERYLAALDASSLPRQALVAVTTLAEHAGEETVEADTRWLGSIRWAQIFDTLRRLEHSDPLLGGAWRSALDLLREQGDFGPMDLDDTAIHAWARRDDAEAILRYFLNELAQPALAHLRNALDDQPNEGAADLIRRGQSAVIWPWRNSMHLKYAIPAAAGEERLRLQFLAHGGKSYFTVEARYQHPKEDLRDVSVLTDANAKLGDAFSLGNDGYGYYWARVVETEQWLRGDSTLDELLAIARDNIGQLVSSGIFTALARLTPASPTSGAPEPPDE